MVETGSVGPRKLRAGDGEGMHTMYTNDGGVICSAKSNYSNKQSRVHLGLSNIIENNI